MKEKRGYMQRRDKFYGWKLLGVFFAIYFVTGAFPYAGGSVINAYMAETLKMNKSILGLGFTIFGFALGFASPLVAVCVNRIGIRWTIFSGAFAITIGTLLMAFAISNAWQFVVTFGIIIGLGVAFSSVIPVQTGVTFWFKKKKALAMSIALCAAGLGGFVAAPVINKMIETTSGNWRSGWVLVSVTSVLAMFMAIFVRNKPSDLGQVPDGIFENDVHTMDKTTKTIGTCRVYHAQEDWKVLDALKTVPLWLIIVASISYLAPFFMCMAHGVIHLKEMNHTPELAAFSIGLLFFFIMIGKMCAGVLGDRIEPRLIWAVALIFMTAGNFILFHATHVVFVYLYTVLMGLGYGMSFVCMATIIGNYYGAGSFASVMGVVLTIASVVGNLVPFLAGLAYDYRGSYSSAFYTITAVCLLSGLLISFAKPPLIKVYSGPQNLDNLLNANLNIVNEKEPT